MDGSMNTMLQADPNFSKYFLWIMKNNFYKNIDWNAIPLLVKCILNI